MGAPGWPGGPQVEAGRAQAPPSLCTPASPPAPPAPLPAAGGPSLGTLGPVQVLGLRSLGSLVPDGQLLELLGVLQLCHVDLGETPGASLPTPGWAA